MKRILFGAGVVLLLVSVSGCGGTKVLKEPEPLVVAQPLATAQDQRLQVTLDWIIVRDGPGTWAKNVDWDEYLIRVQNLGEEPLQVTNITVVDALSTRIEPRENRKQLVNGTKEAERRYKGEGLEVKAGAGVGTLVAAGAVAGAATVAIVAAGPLALGGGAAAAATGGLILVPAFAVGGVMRGVNNSKVNKQIEIRQTLMPINLRKEEARSLNIFLPLTPSPRQIEFTYTDSQGEQILTIDTRDELDGLHLIRAPN